MNNVTIKDIARAANVSYSTVSRALSGHPGINEATRSRINELCEQMGYTANFVARSMVMRQTNVLGLIIPSVDNPFMAELAYHIEQNARAKGYSMMLSNSSYDVIAEEQAFLLHVGRQVDGIILFPIGMESQSRIRKHLSKTPTVFINEDLNDAEQSYVTVDNYRGMYIGTEHLISLGHRSILYFGRQTGSTAHELRVRGFMDACAQYGINAEFCDSDTGATTIEVGYEMAKALFSGDWTRRFTAIFACTDTMALGVLQAADEAGISIPEDVSLLGFDNIRYAALPKINLTTIEQPRRDMARIAVEMLLAQINDKTAASTHSTLTPTLVRRGSCASVQADGRSPLG